MIKKIFLSAFLMAGCFQVFAQSKTTQTLHDKYKGSLAFFFYNNTLRMINQSEDKEFDELIKDIEKMKFLMIDKKNDFSYKTLVGDYKKEAFEEVMTSRHEGKNFDIFIKEKDGRTSGMLVLINDSTNLYVLDIVGRIALDKVTTLYNTLDESTDVGKKIKAFTRKDEENEEDNDDNNKKTGDKKQ